jgi:hypothetical protein
MSYIRTKLNNSIKASKIDIDNENINLIKNKMIRQLSQKNLLLYDVYNNKITIYHMDSLYRDNTNDKYELSRKIDNITIYHMDSLYRDNTNDKYELKKQYL